MGRHGKRSSGPSKPHHRSRDPSSSESDRDYVDDRRTEESERHRRRSHQDSRRHGHSGSHGHSGRHRRSSHRSSDPSTHQAHDPRSASPHGASQQRRAETFPRQSDQSRGYRPAADDDFENDPVPPLRSQTMPVQTHRSSRRRHSSTDDGAGTDRAALRADLADLAEGVRTFAGAFIPLAQDAEKEEDRYHSGQKPKRRYRVVRKGLQFADNLAEGVQILRDPNTDDDRGDGAGRSHTHSRRQSRSPASGSAAHGSLRDKSRSYTDADRVQPNC
jgi:hypothetical protein